MSQQQPSTDQAVSLLSYAELVAAYNRQHPWQQIRSLPQHQRDFVSTGNVFTRCWRRLCCWIGRLIVPCHTAEEVTAQRRENRSAFYAQVIEQHWGNNYAVATADGAGLETFVCYPVRQQANCLPNYEDRRYIINVPDETGVAEANLSFSHQLAKDSACFVIDFNYRGVSQAGRYPHSADELVLDIQAQVRDLVVKGVKPEQITVRGYSFAAALATVAVAGLYRETAADSNNQSFAGLKLFADRTFARFSTALASRVGSVLSWPIQFILALTGWELDVARAYAEIPTQNGDHINIGPFAAAPDQVVPYQVSLTAAVADQAEPFQHWAFISEQLAGQHSHHAALPSLSLINSYLPHSAASQRLLQFALHAGTKTAADTIYPTQSSTALFR